MISRQAASKLFQVEPNVRLVAAILKPSDKDKRFLAGKHVGSEVLGGLAPGPWLPGGCPRACLQGPCLRFLALRRWGGRARV